jgi:hypothetical protein
MGRAHKNYGEKKTSEAGGKKLFHRHANHLVRQAGVDAACARVHLNSD